MLYGNDTNSWGWQTSSVPLACRQQTHIAWPAQFAVFNNGSALSLSSRFRLAGAKRAAAGCAAAASNAPPAAPLLRPLQPHPVPLTAEGLVPNTASLDAVPPQLLPLLDAAVAACQQHLGTQLAGVYLRGSLVQGGFLPGISDADFVALYVEPQHDCKDSSKAAVGELQQAAAHLQHQFPQCVKVELKVVALPAGSPLAQHWLQRDRSGTSNAALPPSVLLDQAGLAFQLKSQSVCLHGWDLPRLLPDVAALPPLQLLPALVEEVEAALRRAQQLLGAAAQCSGSGSGPQQAAASLEGASRAVRWALKRCIRAATELQLASSSSSPGCTSSADASGSGSVYTRDLFWCLQYAARAQPELAQQLTEALQAYVALAAPDTPAGAQRRLAEEGAALAGQLASRLDGLFLQQMLAPEPGWLTHHRGSGGVRSSSSSRGGTQAGSGTAWQRARVGMWAALASSRGGSLEDDLVGAPPPPVTAAVAGSVLTLDWREPAARQQAAAIIAATMAAAADPAALLSADASSSSASNALPPQPVLLKGAAAHWPAVQRWTLGSLAAAGLEGRARLAPSLQFPFTEPRLAALLAAQQGAAALPSCVARMAAAEFAARMQRGNPCALPPLVYGRGGGGEGADAGEAAEYYYFQAELPPQLLSDLDLASPPFQLPAHGGRPAPQLRQTQAARVWVGPQGAISPTHYDLGHSFLTQVKGRKRMLFWSPDQLPGLYCYPDTHLLRRRSRLNMHEPAAQQQASCAFPLAARAAAVVEAVLEPGDVVFFPSRWAHYTESLDFSMSVTCRFQAASSE